MAYLWKYDWWPVITDYDARDLAQDGELETTVTVSPTPPPPSSFPTDWSPGSTGNTPPEEIVPPLPPPTVPHPGVGPVYRDRFGDVVGGESVNPVVVANYGGDGTPDFVMCELVPSIPGSGLTPCEILTAYSGGATLSVLDAATIWEEVRPGGPTSPLGPVYYIVQVSLGVAGGDEAAEGCARPGWTVVDPVCGPADTATANTLDISGGTGLWFDLPDDDARAVLHQAHYGAPAMPGRIGNWAGQSAVSFEGYMVNPSPHPEVVDHRGVDGYLFRPTVDGSSPHPSAYELPYECYFTWDELVAIPDVVMSSSSLSHHFPRGGGQLRVRCWDPNPFQPDLPPEPVDPPPPPPFTPSSVVDVGPGPTGVVRRVRGVVGRHVRP